MPEGALPADPSKHAPHNSFFAPGWYVDQHGTCIDCGEAYVLTKEEQKVWFEEYQIPIHVRRSHCRPCLTRRREEKAQARAEQQAHMEEMRKRPPHPHEAFFTKNERNKKKNKT